MEKHVPLSKSSSASKRWWSGELAEARKGVTKLGECHTESEQCKTIPFMRNFTWCGTPIHYKSARPRQNTGQNG
jgi:hypothetical protein